MYARDLMWQWGLSKSCLSSMKLRVVSKQQKWPFRLGQQAQCIQVITYQEYAQLWSHACGHQCWRCGLYPISCTISTLVSTLHPSCSYRCRRMRKWEAVGQLCSGSDLFDSHFNNLNTLADVSFLDCVRRCNNIDNIMHWYHNIETTEEVPLGMFAQCALTNQQIHLHLWYLTLT